MEIDSIKWLIWSNEHHAWWRPNCQGYTQHKKDAGRYSWSDALDIIDTANYATEDDPYECLIPDLPNSRRINLKKSQSGILADLKS